MSLPETGCGYGAVSAVCGTVLVSTGFGTLLPGPAAYRLSVHVQDDVPATFGGFLKVGDVATVWVR